MELSDKAQRDISMLRISPQDYLHYARLARDYAESSLRNSAYLCVEKDPQERDTYQRLLAYIWLSDGRMLNLLLLSEGLAWTYGNSRYADLFQQTERKAKEERRGIWSAVGQ